MPKPDPIDKPAAPKPPFNIARYRKLVVGIAGLAASLLAQGLIPDPYATYVAAGLAFLTALGIYQADNAKAPADPEAGQVSWGLLTVVLLAAIFLAIVFGWHFSAQ